MQTMDMIVSKKKRIALAKKESLQRASVQQVRNAIHVFTFLEIPTVAMAHSH